ncbi:hypothetical protein [Fodinicola acaciae]|uniref:hypothetical protein n=1 Tax=Fodinicola acaciae TaxID=2681555 RepID=UPI0013D86AD8|nr:hypothetical protein [Fodinicola acaciae]
MVNLDTMSPAAVPVDDLLRAVTALVKAANWTAAEQLLAAASVAVDDRYAQARLAITKAGIAVGRDQLLGQQTAVAAIDLAADAVAAAADDTMRWDIGMLRLRQLYFAAIESDGERDAAAVADLERTAVWLVETAPDEPRTGWACLFCGLIADNVRDDRPAAPVWYRRALRIAEKYDDDDLTWEVLRHLGDHDDDDAGDPVEARRKWEKSAWHAAKAGVVMGVLAQWTLLATLDRKQGDHAAADVRAKDIARWANAIGNERFQQQAERI